MKTKLEFTFDQECPGDKERLGRLMKSEEAHLALLEIAEKVFRPNRKHGYAQAIEKLRDEKGEELIDALEDLFYEILKDHGVDLP